MMYGPLIAAFLAVMAPFVWSSEAIEGMKRSIDSPNVVVTRFAILVDGRPDVEMDLTGDTSSFRDSPVVFKEGIEYRLRVYFRVQHEIVSGLRFNQITTRKGIVADKLTTMVGSYGPKTDEYAYTTPTQFAPKGIISRGPYLHQAKFLDDDRNIIKTWDWSFDIRLNWD